MTTVALCTSCRRANDADDLVILSESASGLQNCLNVIGNLYSTWGLKGNYNTSNVMVFTKTSERCL